MSIPERFYRIARHKLNEIKDRIDQWDEEAQNDPADRPKRATRSDARRELDDSRSDTAAPDLSPGSGGSDARRDSRSASSESARPQAVSSSGSTAPTRRTPEEIARGARPAGQSTSSSSAASNAPLTTEQQSAALEPHYRLLGVEPGSDFPEVQDAYNRYSARCDPSRFPAGSTEATEAERIRERLAASFKVLRDNLDPTARRFDLLEFDNTRSPGSQSAR